MSDWFNVWLYLQRQVIDEAADSKNNQQRVGEDKGSHGVCQLLDLSVSFGSADKKNKKTPA